MSTNSDINITEPTADVINFIENASDNQIYNDPVISSNYIQESYCSSENYTNS